MHSEFSVSDGITRIPDAINCARDDAQGALALTDLNNTFGLVKFYKTAQAQGVKPILGADILVANADDATAPHRMLLLVKNHGGHLFDECAAVEKVAKTRLKDVAPAWTSSWGWIGGFYRPTR